MMETAMTEPLLAVIPTIGVGGPLAILALLFPGAFGSAMLLLRRWLVLFTVATTNSTLYLLYVWLRVPLGGSWWGRPSSLWVVMTLVTLLGVFWSWRRSAVYIGAAKAEQPRRGEMMALAILSCLGLGGVVFVCWTPLSPLDLSWKLLLVFAIGIWVGTIAEGWLRVRRRVPLLPTEGVILTAMIAVFVCLSTTWPTSGTAEEGRADLVGQRGPVVKRWEFSPEMPGMILGAPLVQGDFVYASASHLSIHSGAVYCLDRTTGAKVWQFSDAGRMKPGFSAPCFWEGRVYFGEGWHQDPGCKLYCLDAKSGEKLWDFQTASHTESSPCVADGRVFFGAGEDGIYCVDATTGKKLWQYAEGLHVDANPTVVGKRVYCGSGVDRDKPGAGETAIFCLEADTGKRLWKLTTTLPAWGGATVFGDRVYFSIGNGDFFNDDPEPAGAVLCVDAKSGEEVWRYRVGNGVLLRPAVDDRHVFFSCRNGYCYCVDRKQGKLVRKWDLVSPALASPALVPHSCCGKTAQVIAISSGGKVCCLDPDGDDMLWTWELGTGAAYVASSPHIVVRHTAWGDRRWIYFGAEVGPHFGGFARVICLEDVLPR
jgi:outer membrane protein assembly factor BamB